jgi:diadenosine tetraphosphatase ApaH/serine/threonine PP2A family protein phosphatase
MTFNTVAKIGIGACITGIAVSYLEVSRSHPVMILGLSVAGQALAWMPDFVNRCLDSFNFTAAANQLHVRNDDRGRCWYTLASVPMSERAGFVQLANEVKVSNEQRAGCLSTLERIPASERAGFVQLANEVKVPDERREYCLSTLARITASERTEFVQLANEVKVPDERREYCLFTLARITASERTEFVQSLNNLNMLNEDRVEECCTILQSIPASERAEFVQSLNNLNVRNEDLVEECCTILQSIPASERAEFVQSLNNLNVRNEDLVDYRSVLQGIPASERAGFVQSVNNMYDITEFQLPSTLITQDPLAILSRLANEMQNSRSRFKIKYIDSEAIDAGGVSRDFVTKLLDALFKPGIFPTMVPDLKSDLIIPKFSEKISAECYQGLGLIFADALKQEVCTGCRFHSTLFQMLHSLTNEEIDKIDTVHRQEPYNKMLKLYLQSQYSSQQLNEDELNAFINNDTLPPFIKGGVESKEEFLATTGIDEVIRSTLAIARHTKQRLVLRNQSWDEVKGNTPDDLREKIEGKLTKNDVLHALENPSNHTGTVSNQKGWLVRWINDATPTQLENFVYAISGSKALPLGKPLLIQDDADLNHLPIFHTCSYTVNIPCYQDYNTFKDKFERSLVDAAEGVMQIF